MSGNGSAPQEINVGSCLLTLDCISREIGTLGALLFRTSQELEPHEIWFDGFLGEFEAKMLDAHENAKGKWPSEKTRERLCRYHLMEDEARAPMMKRYLALRSARDRYARRIGELKAEADAQRSVLSALKTEMEATR